MGSIRLKIHRLALLMGLTAVWGLAPTFAQLTKLADHPIGFSPSAPPNIMITIDDSTSMLADYSPDYVVGSVPGARLPGVGGFCRDGSGQMTLACGFIGSATTPGYIYSQGALTSPNNPYPRYAGHSNSSIPDWTRAWPAPIHSSALNRLYYDPATTYRPPMKYDGTSYPNQTLFSRVPADPWATTPSAPTLNYEDLTAALKVGKWCNSDWPNNDEWNPAAGGGSECRINGADYSRMTTNKAAGDYQYPWRKTSATDPDESKFFHVTGASIGDWNKTLWCDSSAEKYPKVLPCSSETTYRCPGKETYSPKVAAAQACFDRGPVSGCVGPVAYTPSGCDTHPAYGFPGPCVGPECRACAQTPCPTGAIGRQGECHLASTVAPGSGGSSAECGCVGAGCVITPSHAACVPYPDKSMGSCSGGSIPIAATTLTCSNDSGACGKLLYDPVAKSASRITMQMDADGAGEVCRRNNQAYPDGTRASPFNFPSGKYTAKVASGCPVVTGFATVPRHYWKSSAEWCAEPVTAANDKWRGFGKPGTCQDLHDLAHPYPRFYRWGVRKSDPEYLDNYTYGAFERVDLDAATREYTHRFYRRDTPVTITRTGIEEMTNYANWFAYYRTRIQAVKTVLSQSLAFVDPSHRLGLHTLSNDPSASFVNVAPFDTTTGGQRDRWYRQLFGIRIRRGENTPTMDAIVRIGELFRNGSSDTLARATDPIVLSCQRNHHLLLSDGMTNQPALPTSLVGNVDHIVPALPEPLDAVPVLEGGKPWPNPYRESGAPSVANSIADYVTHYWVTDLRPSLANDVPSGRDPAIWQHLTFSALLLGSEGVLAGSSSRSVEDQIAAGTKSWPSPTPNAWNPDASGVDDLWHASVNSRGRFVNAKTPHALGIGIGKRVAEFSIPQGSGAAPTFANPTLSSTNNFTYISRFLEGWGGTVQKLRIDPVTTARVGPEIWDAATRLDKQLQPTAADPAPWYSKRRIVTVNEAGVAVPFRADALGVTQLATLGPDRASQTAVIEYLRGRRDNEGDEEGKFRDRVSALGDVVDSQGMLVGSTAPPLHDHWDYLDANDPGYAAFRKSQEGRPGRIYVGAGDGMLHAFDEETGDEAWAFVPRDFYRSAPPARHDQAGLIGLTYQSGAAPSYAHRFYVNATPRIVDANLAGRWKTLLVSGLGKGGKSYFALDATDPSTVKDETTAASKFLWEFRNADLGYTYGQATITKTRAFGGQWLVVVPSGYNNLTGDGKLFFLRAEDGVLVKTLSTGFGTPGSPSGLAHIAGYVQDYRNQLAEQFYAGDLFGNVWRFDVSDSDDSHWKVERFAQLTDGASMPQPITTPVRIGIDVANGVDRWLFVGTGRLLHSDDLGDTQKQRMYALRDGTYVTPSKIAAPLTVEDLDAVSGIAGLEPGAIAKRGWYDELPPGQRIVRTPIAAVGLIAYVATGTPLDPCEGGLPASIYVRQFGNAASKLEGESGLVESIYAPSGVAGLDVIAVKPKGCESNCIHEIRLAVLSSSTSQLLSFKARPPAIGGARRMSWGTLGR